jgi:tetratricopeptide (TPR) repeat protein
MIYFLKGDTAKAQSVVRDVVRENPAYQDAQRILGKTLLASGQLAEAQQVFQSMVLAGGDQEVEGRSQLADLALATGHYQRAQTQLEAGIIAADKRGNTFSATKDMTTLTQLMLDQGSPQQAVRQLAQIRNLRDNPVLMFLTGRAYVQAHRFPEASRILAQLSRLTEEKKVPRFLAVKNLLEAELAIGQHSTPAATAAATRAIEYENSTFAVETLAHCHEVAGRHEDAIREYERVLARANERTETYDSPGFHNVVKTYYKLAVLYQNIGRVDLARERLQIFLKYWSDGDRGLAIYKDARKRLRLLSSPARATRGMPTPAA